MRSIALAICSHGWAVAMACYLWYVKPGLIWDVYYFSLPIFIAPIIILWYKTSSEPLSITEKYCLGYFLCIFLTYQFYTFLCLFSAPEWVFNKRTYLLGFLLVTDVFQLINNRKLLKTRGC